MPHLTAPHARTARLIAAICAVTFLAACGDGGKPRAAAPRPVPTEDQVKAAFLTTEDVGAGFTRTGPAAPDAEKDDIAKDVCGFAPDYGDLSFVATFAHTDAKQVFERIAVSNDEDAAREIIGVHRKRSAAACEYDESNASISYRVRVTTGVPDLPPVGDERVGYTQTYTGGFTGERHAMAARVGRAVVFVEYTMGGKVDAAEARRIFVRAVELAAPLR